MGELSASSVSLFVADEAGMMLTPLLVVGGPLSLFTTPDHIDVSDGRYVAAAAMREGRHLVRRFPEADSDNVTMPFPYLVAAHPIVRNEHTIGVLAIIFTQSQALLESTSDIADRCAEIADAVAQEKDLFGTLGNRSNPLFLLTSNVSHLAEISPVSGTSFLYQTSKLESSLTQATGLKDVVCAVMQRMTKPIGAEKMALVSFEGDRIRVVGQSGYPHTMSQPFVHADEAAVHSLLSGRTLFCENEETVKASRLGGFAGGLKACAVLPLVSGGHAVGALLLGFTKSRSFLAEERAWLVTMAGMVTAAMERARLFDAAYATAKELQQGLLPHHLPQPAELDITARYFSASGDGTGGDWYDVFALPDGRVGLFTGDAEGHSVASAALMGQVRTAVQAYAAEGHGPAEVLTRANALLFQLGAELLVACCCVWVDCLEGAAEIACAGHPGPLVCAPHQEVVTIAEDLIGPPLVVDADTVYSATTMNLPSGTALALFTDGLVRSHSMDFAAGMAAISGMLAASPDYLEDVADRLAAPAADAQRREDDAALLLAVYRGAQQAPGRRVAHLAVQRHDLKAVAAVRRFVCDRLATWDWTSKNDEAELLITELVTNALIHADSEVDIWVREQRDRIRVDVCDWDPRPPLPAPITFTEECDSEAEHGRGLLIVDAVASAWGKTPRGRGKSVWFELQH
ncbi:SpoIIE family protein phosphatase [Streptomyces sp. NPDC058683]|uniref:SpoIIE family protein phosphatase n=1 Tax=Streptomyces sp. NPDC058683 TaxID=3346597 RepID=UPI00364635B7